MENTVKSSTNDILNDSFAKSTWKLAGPTIIFGLLKSSYFLVNSFWISGMGKNALAAMGASTFAIWTTYSLVEIAGTGVYSLMAQSSGANEKNKTKELLGHGLFIAVIIGFIVSALVYLGRNSYFDLIEIKDAEVNILGAAFLSATAWTILPNNVLSVLTSAFRSAGNATTPMWIYAITLLSNLVLDPLFIYGIDGIFPSFGIAGAAYATAISTILGIGLSWVGLKNKNLQPIFSIKKINWQWLVDICSIGLPVAVSGVGFSFVYVLLAKTIALFGPAAIAAVALGHRLESLIYMVCFGFQVSATTLVGQLLGASRKTEIQNATIAVRKQMLSVIIPLSITIVTFAPYILSIFTKEQDVLGYAIPYIRLNVALALFMGLELLYEGAFAGISNTRIPLIISVPLTCLRVPASMLLAVEYGLGPYGIWLAIALSTFTKGIMMTISFNKTMNNIVHTNNNSNIKAISEIDNFSYQIPATTSSSAES